jgi:hypothetical protein
MLLRRRADGDDLRDGKGDDNRLGSAHHILLDPQGCPIDWMFIASFLTGAIALLGHLFVVIALLRELGIAGLQRG